MLTCFKAYDIRGQVPNELNEAIASDIGRAFATYLEPRRVVVGHDVRLSSASLCAALVDGLRECGVDVVDIGLCGTEEVYFSTFHEKTDGGIVVTASHNPMDYNGMKLVREGSRPISGDSGLDTIRELAEKKATTTGKAKGAYSTLDAKPSYIEHLMSYVDVDALSPLKIVVNAGNGGAGLVLDRLETLLPFDFVKVNHEPDGSFPNGIPNPLLPENRAATIEAVRAHGADLGLAWDGDFDRCFFFDEQGRFIEGYYLVGLLAQAMLEREPDAAIIHDPRLVWNTQDIVLGLGGRAVQCKTGHAFIKERMRKEDAIYGGEMSAHHYFRDFAYCDSGMIPWLLVAQRLCNTGEPLSAMVDERMRAFPCSGEINFRVADPSGKIQIILGAYAEGNPVIDETDGVSLAFSDWRFNLRSSNTEPLLRLNVEARGDEKLMRERTAELQALIED